MDADIIDLLKQEDPEDAFHKALLSHGKSLMSISRGARKRNYENWNLQQSVFKGEMVPDKEDQKKAVEGRPVKAVLPTAHAQIMTFVSFHFLQFNQQDRFFNLKPSGDTDYGTKKEDCEQVLEFQLNKNDKNARLFQALLDIGRFGEAALEVSWTKESMKAWIKKKNEDGTVGAGAWEDYIKYEGNRVRNISPFRFFPDTRHALCDFQKGEFCAIEEEFSMNQLYEMEASGEVAGVKHIKAITTERSFPDGYKTLEDVMADLSGPLRMNKDAVCSFAADNGSALALVTKMQVWIIPSKFKLRDYGAKGEKVVGQKPFKNSDGDWVLGEEDHRMLYHLWYANGNRVIKLEPAQWWHNEFGYTVGQYSPDLHQTTTFGLAELIYPIQEFQSWFMNSRVASVDATIQNRFIINSSLLETKSFDGTGNIFMRKGVAVPPDRAVAQLRIQDVTGGHMQDASVLGDVIEQVTGVNKMMQGQSSTGRRSSFQDRTVAGGAAGRMKMHGGLIWETLLGRMGRLMLSNSRQSLSFDAFKRVIGTPSKKQMRAYEEAQVAYQAGLEKVAQMIAQQPELQAQFDLLQLPPPPVDPMADITDRYEAFVGEPYEVICGDDFLVYDNTNPQDKGMMAQSVQELIQVAMANPDAAIRLDISTKALLEELFRLRDAGPVSRFSLKRRIEEGIESPPPPPVEVNQQPQQPPGPTDARQTHTTVEHAPVTNLHIHHAKPNGSNGKAKAATATRK